MRRLRRSDDRGHGRFPGLDSRHTFSFGQYLDPANERVSVLRVINDDRVAPGAGFPTHGHRDAEIVSWVLEGELEHRDSLGHHGVVRAGEMQVMSAGTGITHSEFNGSRTAPLHFLQIWLLPDASGHAPRWQQVDVHGLAGTAGLVRLVGPEGSDAPMTVHQDAAIDRLRLDAGAEADLPAAPGRIRFVHLARGAGTLDGAAVRAGDGVAEDPADATVLVAGDDGLEALVFDLPAGPVALTGADLTARRGHRARPAPPSPIPG